MLANRATKLWYSNTVDIEIASLFLLPLVYTLRVNRSLMKSLPIPGRGPWKRGSTGLCLVESSNYFNGHLADLDRCTLRVRSSYLHVL